MVPISQSLVKANSAGHTEINGASLKRTFHQKISVSVLIYYSSIVYMHFCFSADIFNCAARALERKTFDPLNMICVKFSR